MLDVTQREQLVLEILREAFKELFNHAMNSRGIKSKDLLGAFLEVEIMMETFCHFLLEVLCTNRMNFQLCWVRWVQ